MDRRVATLLVVLVLSGCAGSNAGRTTPSTNTPVQTSTLDATHTFVSETLSNGATVTVSLASGAPPPASPIGVSFTAKASQPAIITLTSSGGVTLPSPPLVTLHLAGPSSHRILAESCRDACGTTDERIVSPTSGESYTFQDAGAIVLGGQHVFTVRFASLPNYQLVDLSDGAPFLPLSPVAINDSDTVVATSSQGGLVYTNGRWAIIPPPPGESSAQPYAISNTGVIVGSSGDRAFRSSGGVTTVLAQLSPTANERKQTNVATAISQDGTQIAGYTYVERDTGSSRLLYYTATDFTLPGGPAPSSCLNGRSVQAGGRNDSQALGVNSAGMLVGLIASSNTLIEDREIYACPVQHALGDGTTFGEALAVNEAGDVAGFLWPTLEAHFPFLYAQRALSILPIPSPSTDGYATALNNSDVVVGVALTSRNGRPPLGNAVVWRDGIATLLNDLLPAECVGWRLESAVGINNRGDIVGTGTKDGMEHAYMLREVP